MLGWREGAVAVLLAAMLPGSASAEIDRREEIDRLVAPMRDSRLIVGMVVGVVQGAETDVLGYGTTCIEGGRTPDGNTIFEIGSLGGAFCSLLLAEMAESGLVSFKDRVSDLLPPLVVVPRYNERDILLRDLATHTGGLPRMPSNLEPEDPNNPYADYTVPRLYRFVSEYYLPREPGAAYEFSNVGMGLLGHALALKEGKSFGELVTERIGEPLGFKDTEVRLSAGQRSRMAQGYNADAVPVPNWDAPALAAIGGLHSTANDLLRLVSANLGHVDTPLSNALERTHEPGIEISRSGDRVAVGWHVQPGGVFWQNGQTGGYHSFVAFLKELDIGVVILANSSVMMVDRLGFTILKMLAGEGIKPLEIKTPVEVAPEIFDAYVGTYELPRQMSLRVFREGDRLLIQPKNQASVRLYPTSGTTYFLKVIDAEVEFLVDEELGRATHVIWRQGTQEIAGRRVEEEEGEGAGRAAE